MLKYTTSYIEHDYGERSPRGINLDSSFDFESASDKSDDNNEDSVSLSHISVAQDNASDSSKFDTDFDDSFSSEGEEVWDEMELLEEENEKVNESNSVNEVVFGSRLSSF